VQQGKSKSNTTLSGTDAMNRTPPDRGKGASTALTGDVKGTPKGVGKRSKDGKESHKDGSKESPQSWRSNAVPHGGKDHGKDPLARTFSQAVGEWGSSRKAAREKALKEELAEKEAAAASQENLNLKGLSDRNRSDLKSRSGSSSSVASGFTTGSIAGINIPSSGGGHTNNNLPSSSVAFGGVSSKNIPSSSGTLKFN
jgi:hypothetical protein